MDLKGSGCKISGRDTTSSSVNMKRAKIEGDLVKEKEKEEKAPALERKRDAKLVKKIEQKAPKKQEESKDQKNDKDSKKIQISEGIDKIIGKRHQKEKAVSDTGKASPSGVGVEEQQHEEVTKSAKKKKKTVVEEEKIE